MQLQEFKRFVKDLVEYFQRSRVPSLRAVELWFEEVKDIPGPDLPEIFRQIAKGEYPSSNLPMAMKTAYGFIDGSRRHADNPAVWGEPPSSEERAAVRAACRKFLNQFGPSERRCSRV